MNIDASWDADRIIDELEANGYGWDVGNAGRLVEARIWKWPNVVGRYRPYKTLPLAVMLIGAIRTMEGCTWVGE